jgi:hypothetical protein
MQIDNFANRKSIYNKEFDDKNVVVMSVENLNQDKDGIIDITQRLQETLNKVKIDDGYGIVMLPQGKYSISETIYIPRAIRLFGFGEKRPKIVLKRNTNGFDKGVSGYREDMKYMFWFTGNIPQIDGEIEDANPGTFYSAMSNIDFEIQDGNTSAVVIRAHFAQNCFVSHCHFEIGNGKAGIHAVGNEMENLSFVGGDWGIYTGKCSPGWPFVMVDSCFSGQRKACMCCNQSGITLSRVLFEKSPVAIESLDGFWDKQILKDCMLNDIEIGFNIAEENNVCTQYNMRNVMCQNTTVFARLKESGTLIKSEFESYLVENFTHGYVSTFGVDNMEKKTIFDAYNLKDTIFMYEKDIPVLPNQDEWISVKGYGAVGDGIVDDTKALKKAISDNRVVYLPQGKYLISDTIELKKDTVLLGFNPISTQIILNDNAPLFAGVGAPKAMLETPVNGTNIVNGIGIDTAARNPRAVACKWQSGEKSYMNDIKFVGGHGRIAKGVEFLPSYNETRTADYYSDRPWDVQYWSLWITNGGGGVFKSIWSASPYAEAGIYISDTNTKGTMYQVSVEHHVRHEVLLKKVSNWSFYAMQTEEEVAEGSYCQPFELAECENLLFANLYAFRVIWVDNSYPSVIKTWNCKNIEIQNINNFTQMKYTIEQIIHDVNSGTTSGFWQLSNLYIGDIIHKAYLPEKVGQVKKVIDNLDSVDAMCKDSKGNIYICDSRLKRIYRWNIKENQLQFITSMNYRPLSLACDSLDNLLVVVEYKPVKYATKNGVDELSIEEFGERSRYDLGACFYQFFRKDRRIRVYTMDPDIPENTMQEILPTPRIESNLSTLYYPANQWRDNNDLTEVITIPDEKCYVAPDGITAITHNPALARATGLVKATSHIKLYEVDEYNKCVLELDVDENLNLVDPKIITHVGEYSVAVTDDGKTFVPDNLLYIYKDGKQEQIIKLKERPACVLLGENDDYLFITARTAFYIIKIK